MQACQTLTPTKSPIRPLSVITASVSNSDTSKITYPATECEHCKCVKLWHQFFFFKSPIHPLSVITASVSNSDTSKITYPPTECDHCNYVKHWQQQNHLSTHCHHPSGVSITQKLSKASSSSIPNGQPSSLSCPNRTELFTMRKALRQHFMMIIQWQACHSHIYTTILRYNSSDIRLHAHPALTPSTLDSLGGWGVMVGEANAALLFELSCSQGHANPCRQAE